MVFTQGRQISVCFTILLTISIVASATVNFTTDQIVCSHDYPKPYPAGVRDTWVWTKDSGQWGVKFIDVDLTESDFIVIDDFHSLPLYISDLQRARFDSWGPRLNITFHSEARGSKGRGFKLDVRHGLNKRDLDLKFLDPNPPPPTTDNGDVALILPLLLAIVSIVLLLFLGIFGWFICHRRRRRQQQDVSLSVNVQGGIRRDSGVRYTRKHSTQSQLEDPPSPRKTTKLVRSNSNQSWMVRAELTATTSTTTTPNGTCNGNGTARTVPNVYTVMENDHNNVKQTFRSRVPTLEKVNEDQLMTKVPVCPIETSQDDGYLGPSPKSPAIAYLNCPITGRGEVTDFNSSSSTGSCDAGYQNITVTGRVAIS